MVRLSLCVVSGRGIGSQFGPGRDETVTRSRRVGVDVEAEPSGEKSLDFIVDHLSPRERGEPALLPSEHRHAALLRAWVCKEAHVKALGLGLGPSAITRNAPVLLTATDPARLPRSPWFRGRHHFPPLHRRS